VEALAAVMDRGRPADRPLLVGAAKANLGHAEAASGVAGLMKVVLSLQHEEIPPLIHLEKLNPRIPWGDYRIAVPTKLTPWPRGARRRLAGVSAFGFSGTNVHVVLEEAPLPEAAPAAAADRPLHAIALRAKTEPALRACARDLALYLESDEGRSLADAAYTVNVGRAQLPQRALVLAASGTEARERLAAVAEGREGKGIVRGRAGGEPPRVAFLFTGQGSQYAGMGRRLYETEPTFKKALDRCADALQGRLEKPLLEVMFGSPGAEGLVDRTGYTQPCLFALEWALAELWRSWGIEPGAVMGHSVGEFVAATVAGVLSVEDGLRLIAERARLMEELPAGGEMAAAHASEDRVREVLGALTRDVSFAAINGPASVVISGPADPMREARVALGQAGVKCQDLVVSHAFHSALLEPMLGALEKAAGQAVHGDPRIDLVSNLTGKVAEAGEIGPGYWRRHARQPVRFWAGLESLRGLGYEVFVEVGPAPVLAGMGQRGDLGKVEWVPSLRKGKDDWNVLLEGLGKLWVRGATVDWSGFDRDRPRRKLALPTYPFQRERYWAEAPATAPGPSRGRAGHPFLLSHLRLAEPPHTHVFEGQIGLGLFPYLRDHRVQQGVVVPATAYTEMALAAHAQAFGEGPVGLREIEYKKPLFLADDATHVVQVVLSRDASGEAAFHVATRAAAGASAAWTLHVSGRIRALGEDAVPEVAERPSLEAIRAQCPEEVPGAEFYRLLHERGNEWGPTFQGVERLFRGQNEAWSEVRVPDALASQVGRYLFHPAVGDASGHVLTATVPMEKTKDARGGAFVGGGIDEVRVYRRPQGARLWAYARLRPTEGARTNILVGDVRVFDETGAVVSELRGARLWYLDQDARPMARASVLDWLYEVAWREAPRGALRRAAVGPAAGKWLVVSAGGRLGPALLEAFRSRGEDAQIAQAEEAAAAIASGVRGHRGVLYVFEGGTSSGDGHVGPARRTGVASAVSLIQALSKAASPARLWVLTSGAQPVGGSPPADVTGAALWGLGRSAALEASDVFGGLVDLDPGASPPDAAALAVDEVLAPDAEVQVAYRDGKRFGPRLARLRPDRGGDLVPRPDGAYLVTGGLGGLGLLMARWLVERGARRVVLMGRTPLPPRSDWAAASGPRAGAVAAVRELERLGASVHLAPLDVGDEGQLSAWLEGYRSEAWPEIRGVVHAAGVMQYRSLLEQDEAGLDEVMRAKVEGARLLDRLLADAPLDFFVLFSSASSLLSSPLLGGYAAGNAFLDALAHARRAAGRPALSVNWGMWGEVGMVTRFDASDVATLALRGMGSIAPDQGTEALDRLVAAGVAQAGVLPVDWDEWRQRYPALAESPFLEEVVRGGPAEAEERAPGEDARAAILAAAPEERARLVVAHVAEQVCRVMQVPTAKLDPGQPLKDFGLDSLMAVEIRNRVEATLGVSLPLVSILEGQPVAQLAASVRARLEEVTSAPAAAARGPAPDPGAIEASRLLEELPDLSEEQVDALLKKMMEKDRA
jgi:acyl transferase domain-containing protein